MIQFAVLILKRETESLTGGSALETKLIAPQKYIDKEEIEKQLKEIVLRASLPLHAAKKLLEWAEKDTNREKEKSEGIVSTHKLQLTEAEEKLDRLLEGYLDKVISPEDYQKKKNELVETKSLFNSKIKEISQNGVEWLEPFQEFANSALSAQKIVAMI